MTVLLMKSIENNNVTRRASRRSVHDDSVNVFWIVSGHVLWSAGQHTEEKNMYNIHSRRHSLQTGCMTQIMLPVDRD